MPRSFGVSMHFLDVQLSQHIDYLQRAHLGWVRRDMFWSQVESVPGIYDFTLYDALVAQLRAAGVRVTLILDYSNPIYLGTQSPTTAAGQAAFARFASAAARHFIGQVDAWEIYNEPNNAVFWLPSPNAAQYVALANAATAAIRAADPNAVVVGPALAGPWSADSATPPQSTAYAFLTQVLASKAAKDWSAITIHPYRSPGEMPEGVVKQIDDTRTLMSAAGIDPTKIPVIIGEWGYSTFDKGVDETTQAAYAARSFLICAMEHMPYSIWYDWQDDGTDASNNEDRFGLLRNGTLSIGNLSSTAVKPSYTAVMQLGSALQGFEVDRVVTNSGGVMILRLLAGANIAYAVWSSDNLSHTVNVPAEAGTWTVAPLLGTPTLATVNGTGGFTVTSEKMPILILRATSATPSGN